MKTDKDKAMKTPRQLINNIIGQLNGVNRMIEDNKDCLDVLIQLKAARSAMDSLANRLIENDIIECSTGFKNKKEKDKVMKLLKELSKNK